MSAQPVVISSLLAGLLAGGLTAAAATGQEQDTCDPLCGFEPARRAVIEAGTAVVEVLPARDDDFGVAGAARTSIDTDRFMTWVREVEQLHGGRYVPLIQRFSSTPRIEDLTALVLDDEELEDLRDCRPGRCDLKLAAHEIVQIRDAIRRSGDDWKRAALEAFRRMVLGRATAYLQRGHAGIAPYADHRRPARPADEFRLILSKFKGNPLLPPRLAAYLRDYPNSDRNLESFLYWSKDLLGDIKPIVSITHLVILPATAEHPMIVATTQVFATHYLVASLSLTGLMANPVGTTRYIVYSRWTRTDVFDGTFGGLVRRLVNKRVRAEGPPVLHRLRSTLESGVPQKSQRKITSRPF